MRRKKQINIKKVIQSINEEVVVGRDDNNNNNNNNKNNNSNDNNNNHLKEKFKQGLLKSKTGTRKRKRGKKVTSK